MINFSNSICHQLATGERTRRHLYELKKEETVAVHSFNVQLSHGLRNSHEVIFASSWIS